MNPPRIKKVLDANTAKTIDVKKPTPNELRGEEIYKEPLKKNVHTIQGVSINDIDGAVIDKIKNIFENTHSDKIKIYDFSKDRFNEIIQSWDNKTQDDSFNLPFINISRETSPKRGTNFGKVNYNVPNNHLYSVVKVPVVGQGGLTQYEHYQVPQPINIDLEYSITILTNTMREINKFDEKMVTEFRSAQVYIKVNGAHYMPLKLVNEADEKNEDDIEKRRFHRHVYKISLTGYIIPEDEIVMLKSAKNMNLNVKLNTNKSECFTDTNIFKEKNNECLLSLTFFFKRRGANEQQTTLKNNLNIYADNQDDPNTYKVYLNNIEQTLPFNGSVGDVVKIENVSGSDKNYLLKLYAENL
jgi:hypothetical protein